MGLRNTSDSQGRFRIEVPEGTHSVVLWHSRLPEVSKPITVKTGQTVRLEQEWAVSQLLKEGAGQK